MHPFFPKRANAEFITMEADGSVRMRVWERGVGETQACGTGATAVGAACVRLGLAESPVVVHLLGGDLVIDVQPGGGEGDTGSLRVHMTGPAEEVFSAEISGALLSRLGWR
jgi:diaminopimelate epimerase